MNKLIILFTFLFTFSAYAQKGKIAGKIVDGKTGEVLPGASILIEGTTLGTSADMDGHFSISSITPGTYTVILNFITYETKKITDVKVLDNDVTELNFSLNPADPKNLNEVVVEAQMNRENTNALLMMQKNNASVSDGISSDMMKKTPDRTTGDILKRVSGASIQDNKFAVIRGLNDRYNAAYINGSPLPSSESDRKAFSFDIFPTNLLDNLIINKTATPDMPAEFAGGIIQVNTKSIPEKNFQSISVGSAYNTVTTGKQQLTYAGGKTDWIGVDDGTRALPGNIPDAKNYPTTPAAQADLAKTMKNDWGITSKKFDPNRSFQYSMGQTFKVKGRDFFGMLLSATYSRNYNFVTTARKGYASSTDLAVPSQLEFDYVDKTYATQTLAGLLGNFSTKINSNNTISFKNLFSINSDDRVIERSGSPTPLDVNPVLLKSNVQWFTSNKIYTGQLIGDHYLPASKIKINWISSFSNIKRDIPNLRRSVYTKLKNVNNPVEPYVFDTIYKANVATANVGPSYGGGRFYSTNEEKIYSAKADASYSFKFNSNFKNEVKIGGGYQKRERTFSARQIGYTRHAVSGVKFTDSLLYLPENQIFAQQNMGIISPGKGGFKLKDVTKPTDAYTANSEIISSFIMFDQRYKESIRFIWGARMENFTQNLNATLDNKDSLRLHTTKLDILPSANLIYSINSAQNIRVCYSQTLNRPEFRELAPFAFYDFNTQFVYSGNDTLKRALIKNYDVRYEVYPGRGQLFSVSGFYKSFINPIEQISRADVSNEVSFKNVPKAKSYGVEIEFRTLLGALLHADSNAFLNSLTLYSNYAYIKSAVDVSQVIGTASKERALQGQSPYIFNAGLMYNNADYGVSFSAAVNRIGQRIAIVGNINEPDIWENGRTVLDLQIGKTLLKDKLEIRLFAKDILAQKLYFFQDRNNNKKLDTQIDDLIWVSRFGPTFSGSVVFKF